MPEKQLEQKLYEHAPYDPWLLSQDTSYLRFKRFVFLNNNNKKKMEIKKKPQNNNDGHYLVWLLVSGAAANTEAEGILQTRKKVKGNQNC